MKGKIQAIRYHLGDLPNRIRNWVYALPTVEINEVAQGVEPPQDHITDGQNYPPQHDGGPQHDDMSAFLQMVISEEPDYVLELGTGRGNGTANLCAFTQAHVYTVNALPEQIDGDFTTFALGKGEIGEVYRTAGFDDRVTQIYANTKQLNLDDYVDDESVDLAVIDACHDTEFVLNDFQLVHPKMRRGGTILLHDTHPSREYHLHGSYDACTRLRRRGYDIKHIHGTWWGFYRR